MAHFSGHRLVALLCAYGFTLQSSLAQASKTQTTIVSPQQIAAVLRQKLPDAAQETGGGLFDGSDFRIGTLKRKRGGEAEIHHTDTDILYILSGKATLITGGQVAGLHPISATEERGTAIRNGVRHPLQAGDVIIIPRQEPHWFQSVTGQVTYLVIKVQ